MQFIDLNTTWQFTLDPENQGLKEAWFKSPDALSKQGHSIEIPTCWEEQFEDYEGVAWYSKAIELPTADKGSACRLKFSASNYRTSLWINGKAVATHEGGYTPFEFQIQDFVDFGCSNHFAIRVVGPIITKDIRVDDLGPNDMPHWRGGLTAGIWQSLQIEINQDSWIDHVFYKPDVTNSSFDLDAQINSVALQAQDALLRLQLRDTDGELASEATLKLCLQPGSNSLKHSLKLEQPRLWSSEQPHLYTAEMSLHIGDSTVSESNERIGLREFTFEGGRFFLNGKPTYLRGGFWEGVYAEHQSYPANREVVRKEIELAKAAGLNLLRPWRRPVPPMILEEADAAGIFIIGSPAVECMSCWPTATPEAPARIESEIRSLVLRDRNHASIIWWEMFNEVTRVELARLIPTMSLIARDLDPTRLILDESGGWADGAHFYLPHSRERQRLIELHSYVRAPVDDKHWELYQNLGKQDTVEGNAAIKAGTPIFMSEFGFGSLPEIETSFELFKAHGNPKLPAYRQHEKLLKDISDALEACELDTVYPNVDSFCRDSQAIQARGNRRQLEAILANPIVSGYCIHAFTDGDWILGAGLIDHWQRPKAAYHAIAAANKSPSLLLFPKKRNLEPNTTAIVDIIFKGETELPPAHLEVRTAEGHYNLSDSNWTGEIGFLRIQCEIPGALLADGSNKIQIHASDVGNAPLCSATLELYVVPTTTESPDLPVVIYDPDEDLAGWRTAQNYSCTPLHEWDFNNGPCIFLFANEDVATEDDLALVESALQQVESNGGTALFIEPPSLHESNSMIRQYDACPSVAPEENKLLQSGIFPIQLVARPSFSFWESSMHVAKEHPIFTGLPTNCMMDEPYHEVAPMESFYELTTEEAPANTITWFRPEEIATKAKMRTYLGGDELWHGTDIGIVTHGKGKLILSTLILRSKASSDPVAARLLTNAIHYACTLHSEDSIKIANRQSPIAAVSH